MPAPVHIHIIDDDPAIRDSLAWLFGSRGHATASYDSAESFLAAGGSTFEGCLLLDIRMDGMSGLELFDRLQRDGCRLPVVFLTGHGDVPMAVEALKKGARDFLEKPFNDNELVDRIEQVLRSQDEERARADIHRAVRQRLAALTSREREVMDGLLASRMNKVIADDLGITMRTVEVHRARVFEKMGVRSAVELAQLLARISEA